MLIDQEQRSRNEVERTWTGDSRRSAGLRALAVGAVGIAIMFVVIGAPWAGLVVLAVPALGWVLSRYWQDIGKACEAVILPVDGWVADDASSQHSRRVPEAE